MKCCRAVSFACSDAVSFAFLRAVALACASACARAVCAACYAAVLTAVACALSRADVACFERTAPGRVACGFGRAVSAFRRSFADCRAEFSTADAVVFDRRVNVCRVTATTCRFRRVLAAFCRDVECGPQVMQTP